MNPQREVLYKGVVGVKAAAVAPQNSVVTMPEGVKAGNTFWGDDAGSCFFVRDKIAFGDTWTESWFWSLQAVIARPHFIFKGLSSFHRAVPDQHEESFFIRNVRNVANCCRQIYTSLFLPWPGSSGAINVQLRDEFNNTVADASPSNLVALIRHEDDTDFDPLYLHPAGQACSLGELDSRYQLEFRCWWECDCFKSWRLYWILGLVKTFLRI